MSAWDIDRYVELQDRAWELDSWANEQDTNAKRSGRRSESPANRARADAHRSDAAQLLTHFWTFPISTAPVHSASTPWSTRRTSADALPAPPTSDTNEEATSAQAAEARADDDGWPSRADASA